MSFNVPFVMQNIVIIIPALYDSPFPCIQLYIYTYIYISIVTEKVGNYVLKTLYCDSISMEWGPTWVERGREIFQ